jgi:alpha-L-fucosidase 2
MEDYRFTKNVTFLKQWYPTMKGAAQFFADFMTDYQGMKVTNPTLSPENRYYVNGSHGNTAAITMGPAMDNQM